MTATDPLPVLAKEPPSPPSTPPESVQSYIYYWTGPGAALAVVPRWSWQSIPPLPAGRIDPHLASMEANTMLFLHLFSSTDDEKVVQDPRNPAPAKALRRSASCHLRSDHPSRPPPPRDLVPAQNSLYFLSLLSSIALFNLLLTSLNSFTRPALSPSATPARWVLLLNFKVALLSSGNSLFHQ